MPQETSFSTLFFNSYIQNGLDEMTVRLEGKKSIKIHDETIDTIFLQMTQSE